MPVILRLFGFHFIPSMEWAAAMRDASTVFGLVLGLAFAGWLIATRADNPKMKDKGPNQLLLLFVGGTLFAWVCAAQLVLLGWPMAAAGMVGQETRIEFVVKKAEGFSDSKCRQKVDLMDMPTLNNRLCGVSETVRSSLRPGDRIGVWGRGTPNGVFYTQIGKAP